MGLKTIVRADRGFTLEQLMQEPTQPRVQRANLSMDARYAKDEDSQIRELVNILREPEHVRCPAVVYVWRRVTADALAKKLRVLLHGGVRAYHGSMNPDERTSVQDGFMAGLIRVVVATMAFGMGLDKPDIRRVIHFNIPKSIENFIQETGRGSRDGAPGRCFALVNRQDYKIMRKMETAGGGGTHKASVVKKLLTMIFRVGKMTPKNYHVLSQNAIELLSEETGADGREIGSVEESSSTWRPYYVGFE